MEGVRKRKSSAMDGEQHHIKEQLDVEKRIIVKKRDEKEHNTLGISESKSLPEDLWMEDILTRLPVGTLARCSLMSKLWYNSIFKDARFAAVHNVENRNKKNLILNLLNVFRGGKDNAFFCSFIEDNHLEPKILTRLITGDVCELVGYANGLACIKIPSITNDVVGSVIVVNPMKSHTLTLSYITPTGGYMYLCHGFGFDSLSQAYKAVIIFTSKDNSKFLCMAITLGTCSWRNITTKVSEMLPPPGSSRFPSRMVTRLSRSFYKAATFCEGDLLWRTTSKVDNDCKIEMLLSFDLRSEKIRFIRLPDESSLTTTMNEHNKYLAVDHLLEFKGYPCIARSEITISISDHSGHCCDYQSNLNCCCCCKVHMSILKDKVNQVWIREETFDVEIKDQEGLLPAPLCCYFGTNVVTPPTRILTLSDEVLLYWFNGECLILYNLLEKNLKVVKCSGSYPGIFRTKMNETLSRRIGDDNNIYCPYMDYQLHAQVENLVSMKTFIPKGAKTKEYDCFEDFQHAIKGNIPEGWVVTGRESLNFYVFRREDKEVDEVNDNNGSCRSKKSKIQSTGLELSELTSVSQTTINSSEKVLSASIPVPIEEWMGVLNSIPDLEIKLYLDAINFLVGDVGRVSTFMGLIPGLRKKWLIGELRTVY